MTAHLATTAAPSTLFDAGGPLQGFQRVQDVESARAKQLRELLASDDVILGELPDGRYAALDFNDLHRFAVEER